MFYTSTDFGLAVRGRYVRFLDPKTRFFKEGDFPNFWPEHRIPVFGCFLVYWAEFPVVGQGRKFAGA